jgi:Fe-S oxidoreductase
VAEGASTPQRGDKPQPAALYQAQEEPARLLVAKDEMRWMTQNVTPDRKVDVFLLLGCGARGLPHIFLDSVSVLEALGVSFVAAAGQQFCCGNPYRPDRLDAADRLTANSIDRMTAWGASTIVHWCTACQVTFGAWSRNSEEVWSGGEVMPMRPRGAPADDVENVHIHSFIERRLLELGDRVPWKRTAPRRVLVEGHPELTEVHDAAMTTGAKMLSLVPGVEVLGYVKAPEAFARPGSN